MKVKKIFKGLKLNIKITMVILVTVTLVTMFWGILISRNAERNIVDENIQYMQYAMYQNLYNIESNIAAVSTATQFFITDKELKKILCNSVEGKKMTSEELLEFYNEDIASLERLVNSNPMLYGVHVYAVNDDVQEMMPILYQKSRMDKLEWAQKETYFGWNYDYRDVTFGSLKTGDNHRILSLVTPITDFENGTIGIIEAAVTMKSMFPLLYEKRESEWSCFVTDDGSIYFGNEEQENARELIQREIKGELEGDEIQTYYQCENGQHLVICRLYLQELGGTLFSVQDISGNISGVRHQEIFYCIAVLFSLVVVSFIVDRIVRHVLKQFYEILASMRKVQQGNLDERIKDCGTDEMGELGTQFNQMLDNIEQLMQENLNREILVKNSEIRALQNQINSHFIYNVLESIKMMAEIDEEYAISDAITSLGKLLRYSMKWVSGNVLVRDELEYIRNYLALMNLRFDYEIQLSVNIPEVILCQDIPKMSLQPIVENAIYHGIEQMAEDTTIYMKGIVEENDCVIEITDAGRGMTEEEVAHLEQKIAGEVETDGGSGHGIGLKNVQDRIHMSFGEGYGIRIASKFGCYTKVMMRIPMKKFLLEKEGEVQ